MLSKIRGVGINRYMLGCKSVSLAFAATSDCELIDTCWDVNRIGAHVLIQTRAELIDTCWDVNVVAAFNVGNVGKN